MKRVNKGQMTGYLFSEYASQLKIRGPFGKPCLPERRKIDESIDQVIFICGGNDVTVFVQLVKQYLLIVGQTLKVIESFESSDPLEASLNIGDEVVIEAHRLDSWCFGTNFSTGQVGSFPVKCTQPPVKTQFVLVDFRSDGDEIGAKKFLEGAVAAYPEKIKVNSFQRSAFKPDSLDELFKQTSKARRKIIVCGGESMIRTIVEIIEANVSRWDVHMSEVQITEC